MVSYSGESRREGESGSNFDFPWLPCQESSLRFRYIQYYRSVLSTVPPKNTEYLGQPVAGIHPEVLLATSPASRFTDGGEIFSAADRGP